MCCRIWKAESKLSTVSREKSRCRDSTIFPDVFHCQADMPPGLDDRTRIENVGYSENNGKEREIYIYREKETDWERRGSRYRGEGAERERKRELSLQAADRGTRVAASSGSSSGAKRKQEGDRHLALLLSLGFGPILKWSRLSVNNLLCPGPPLHRRRRAVPLSFAVLGPARLPPWSAPPRVPSRSPRQPLCSTGAFISRRVGENFAISVVADRALFPPSSTSDSRRTEFLE